MASDVGRTRQHSRRKGSPSRRTIACCGRSRQWIRASGSRSTLVPPKLHAQPNPSPTRRIRQNVARIWPHRHLRRCPRRPISPKGEIGREEEEPNRRHPCSPPDFQPRAPVVARPRRHGGGPAGGGGRGCQPCRPEERATQGKCVEAPNGIQNFI